MTSLVLVAALLAASCGQSSTPERTFDALRAVASGLSPVQSFRLFDDYARSSSLQLVRDVRARLARGDAPEDVFRGLGMTEEQARSAQPDEEIAALVFAKYSPIARWAKWLESAMPAAPTEYPEPGVARMRLRGTDGREGELWLALEEGRWCVNPRRGLLASRD